MGHSKGKTLESIAHRGDRWRYIKCETCDLYLNSRYKSRICIDCLALNPDIPNPVKYAQPSIKGYPYLRKSWVEKYYPVSIRTGEHRYLEHRVIMEDMLGRQLVSGENVHHINGVKTDNRPENLELWVTSQPSGQRPKDLVAWAEEILIKYKDFVEKDR